MISKLKKVEFKVWALIIIYFIIFSFFSIMRHLSSKYGDPDFGLFNQAFYSTAFYGKLFYNTFENGSHFHLHNSPVFFLLLPFYYIYPGIITLLLLQTAFIAVSAWPFYLIAKEKLSEKAGLLFVVLYLLYHPLHGVNYDQFHELAFSFLPLMSALYFFIIKRNMPLTWLFLMLAMICKEDVSFIISFFGFYVIYTGFKDFKTLKNKLTIHGLSLIFVGILYLYLSLYVIIPYFNPPGVSYGYFTERYGYFGNNLPEALKSIFFHPVRTLKYLLIWPRISYFLETFFPLAFLSFWHLPLLIPTIPIFGTNLLSSYSTMYNSGSRYPSLLIPFVFVSAVIGLCNILKKCDTLEEKNKKYAKIIKFPIIFTILSTLLLNPSPFRLGWKYPKITQHQRTVLRLIKEIPKDASISTQADIYQHTSSRLECYSWYHEGTQYIIVDPASDWYKHAGWDKTMPEVLKSGKYELKEEEDGILIYKLKE